MTDRKRLIWLVTVGGMIAFGLLLIAWLTTSATKEERRWQECIGKLPADCSIPPGYVGELRPCQLYEDCLTHPRGVSYLSIVSSRGRGSLWVSYLYAVIALDAQGRIVKVEIKRHFAAL